jgi:hypothetical protein
METTVTFTRYLPQVVLRFRHIVQWLKIGPIGAYPCKQKL